MFPFQILARDPASAARRGVLTTLHGDIETPCFLPVGTRGAVKAIDVGAVVRNLMAFFDDESCGQCTPCRVGCEKMLHLIDHAPWNGPLMTELSEAMRDASICGLGQAAANPVLCALRYFPGEVG